MSPFDALGAAAAILQIIELGVKLGDGAIKVYNSKEGTSRELEELGKTTAVFEARNEEVVARCKSAGSGTASDNALLNIALQCRQTATTLVQLVDELKIKGDRTAWKAVKLVVKSEFKKDEIKGKQRELKQWRTECNEQILKMLSDDQHALFREFQRFEQRHSDMSMQLTAMRTDVLDALRDSRKAQFVNVSGTLLRVERTATLLLPRENILRSLRYAEMRNRWDTIKKANPDTYDWMFDQTNLRDVPSLEFSQWLRDQEGIFWITGKAGSGKSTLMKHISDHPRTLSSLSTWAKDRKLVIASHYFWFLGSRIEKSFEGLLKSILYKVLEECQESMPIVCPDRWADEMSGRDSRNVPWSYTELQDSILMLTKQHIRSGDQDVCFCFFIDGLDEYDGDHHKVTQTLLALTTGTSIKVCASSRPWNVFHDAFESSKLCGNWMELHLFTKGDIATVVEQEIGDTLAQRFPGDEGSPLLVAELVDRSQGVFLWVALVIKKELIPCLENREDLNFLRRRLESIPNDLFDYFQRIFARIWADTKYRQDTARLFRSCLAASQPLPMEAVSVIVHDNPQRLAIDMPTQSDYAWDRPEIVSNTRAQVNGRCQDLLAVVAPSQSRTTIFANLDDSYSMIRSRLHRIEFLHRTVHDFLLETDAVNDELRRHAGDQFDPHSTLLSCYMVMIKKVASLRLMHDSNYASSVASYWSGQLPVYWSTEALLHAGAVHPEHQVSELLSELDRNMSLAWARTMRERWNKEPSRHWSSGLFSFETASSESLVFGQRDLVGHLITFGLVHEVKSRLSEKQDLALPTTARPYLDYALRWLPPATESCTEAQILAMKRLSRKPDMVQALLELGCNVNAEVGKAGDLTVWKIYLRSLYDEQQRIGKSSTPVTESALRSREDIEKITWLLIRHGAPNVDKCPVASDDGRDQVCSARTILQAYFGPTIADQMHTAMLMNSDLGAAMSPMNFLRRIWGRLR